MRNKVSVTAMVVALALSVLATPALAQDGPPAFNQPHNHALLIGADVQFVAPPPGLPPYVIRGFDRCVPLAGGRRVPLNAHHDRVHFGTAGEALIGAGHLVVPLELLGFASCDQLEAALPFPS